MAGLPKKERVRNGPKNMSRASQVKREGTTKVTTQEHDTEWARALLTKKTRRALEAYEQRKA
jgi:hypothetical protein